MEPIYFSKIDYTESKGWGQRMVVILCFFSGTQFDDMIF